MAVLKFAGYMRSALLFHIYEDYHLVGEITFSMSHMFGAAFVAASFPTAGVPCTYARRDGKPHLLTLNGVPLTSTPPRANIAAKGATK